MPWTSAGNGSPAIHAGSRCRPKRSAAAAHWPFRCCVGATTTRLRPGCAARSCRAAVSAKVVFPAPGVATARKSSPSREANTSSAFFCHFRRRIVRLVAPKTAGPYPANPTLPRLCQAGAVPASAESPPTRMTSRIERIPTSSGPSNTSTCRMPWRTIWSAAVARGHSGAAVMSDPVM